MEQNHGEDVAPDRIAESVQQSFVAHTADEPLIAAPMPTVEPGGYHRTINVAWWAGTLAASALIWAALLA